MSLVLPKARERFAFFDTGEIAINVFLQQARALVMLNQLLPSILSDVVILRIRFSVLIGTLYGFPDFNLIFSPSTTKLPYP